MVLSIELILAMAELVASIWSAVVCCKAVCCVPGLVRVLCVATAWLFEVKHTT